MGQSRDGRHGERMSKSIPLKSMHGQEIRLFCIVPFELTHALVEIVGRVVVHDKGVLVGDNDFPKGVRAIRDDANDGFRLVQSVGVQVRGNL